MTLKAVITILLCTACLAVGCTRKDTNPSEASIKAFRSLQVNDVESFIDNYDISQGDKSDFHAVCDSTVCKAIESKGGIADVSVQSETLSDDGQQATVTMVITYGDGSKSEICLEMVFRDGKWLQKLTI